MSAPLTIIGTGLAGYTTAREFRKLDSDMPLRFITADDGAFYSKPMLSNALAQNKTPASLATADASKMAAQLNAEILPFSEVTALAPAEQCVYLGDNRYEYSRLVLAWGAQQRLLPLAGDAADRVLVVNNLAQYTTFRDRLRPGAHVAIMGAGLIGCEFANDLRSGGYQVSVIDLAQGPLSRLVPPEASSVLCSALAAIGVRWQFGTTVQAMNHTDNGNYALQLANGDTLQADLVLSAIGLQPQTELAAAAGLRVNHGIVVDRWLQTLTPNVYALGDCMEVEGLVLPYVMPLMQAARALAKTLAGTPTPLSYPPMPVVVKTPACPTVVAPPPANSVGRWQIEQRDYHLKALFYSSTQQLYGFVLMGDFTQEKQALTKQLPAWLA